MIYELTFKDGRIEYCAAKDKEQVIENYQHFDVSTEKITGFRAITKEESKTIIATPAEYDPESHILPKRMSVYDLMLYYGFSFENEDSFALLAVSGKSNKYFRSCDY